jgi:replicative DNA helicase
MPAAVDIERLVLGSILVENDANYFASVADLLEESDFSVEKNRVIYSTLQGLYSAGRSLDRVSLSNALIESGRLSSVDGLSYLVSLDEGSPRAFSIETWCQILSGKGTMRRAITMAQSLIQQCTTSSDAPDELMQQAEQLVQLLSDTGKRESDLETAEQIIATAGGINEFVSPARVFGIPWMFEDLQNTTVGMRPGQLIVLGARPAVGKSAFAMQQGVYVAGRRQRTAIYSLEMSSAELLSRHIASRAEVSAMRWRRNELNSFERMAVMDSITDVIDIEDSLLISEKPRVTTASIARDLRRQAARGRPVEFVVVDYLQLMGTVGKHDSREQEVSSISRGLKLLAKEFKIPVLALVQLKREADARKGGRPELSDLRESGSLEQDADVVLFQWIDSLKAPNPDDEIRDVNWRVAKQRSGPLNEGVLPFRKKFVRFEEPEDRMRKIA